MPRPDSQVELLVGESPLSASNPLPVGSASTETLTFAASGEWAPGTSASQAPTVAANLVRFKARAANTGEVYLGRANTVSVANGSTDTTSGLELAAGDDTGWIPVANLNVFWGIGDGATDSVLYWVLA